MILAGVLLPGALLPLSDASWTPAVAGAVVRSLINLPSPDWNRSLMVRGHASERMGLKDDALADYSLAIESRTLTGGEQAQALFDRANLFEAMGQTRDALDDYDAALSLYPNFVAALNRRGAIQKDMGRIAEARRDYAAAAAAGGPFSAEGYYGLGQIAEAEGDREAARAFYTRAGAANPTYALAAERLAALTADAAPTSAEPNVPALGDPGEPVRHLASAPILAEGAPPPSRPGLGQVQLGSWRSEAEAARGWNILQARAGGALNGRSAWIMPVVLPGSGRFYRLRVAAGQGGAGSLCTVLATKGLACLAMRE